MPRTQFSSAGMPVAFVIKTSFSRRRPNTSICYICQCWFPDSCCCSANDSSSAMSTLPSGIDLQREHKVKEAPLFIVQRNLMTSAGGDTTRPMVRAINCVAARAVVAATWQCFQYMATNVCLLRDGKQQRETLPFFSLPTNAPSFHSSTYQTSSSRPGSLQILSTCFRYKLM